MSARQAKTAKTATEKLMAVLAYDAAQGIERAEIQVEPAFWRRLVYEMYASRCLDLNLDKERREALDAGPVTLIRVYGPHGIVEVRPKP